MGNGKADRSIPMFQSMPVTGRQHTEALTPLPCPIIPLKGEVYNRRWFSIKSLPSPAFLPQAGKRVLLLHIFTPSVGMADANAEESLENVPGS
jgi:hypothetical protein